MPGAWLLGLIPGGFGDKADDWLERQQKVQSSLRRLFAAVAAYEQKANGMQFASHEETHPALRRKRADVKVHKTTRGDSRIPASTSKEQDAMQCTLTLEGGSCVCVG